MGDMEKTNAKVEVYYGGDETIPAGKDSNWGEYWWNASNTGYSMRKFLDPSYDATGTTMHTTPWFFIRLSEIYLNYAECQIELGNNLEALEYINKYVPARFYHPLQEKISEPNMNMKDK